MTIAQAALKIGIGRTTLYALVAARKIAHYRVGGKIIFADEDIAAFLAGCRIVTAPAHTPAPAPRLKLKHITLSRGG